VTGQCAHQQDAAAEELLLGTVAMLQQLGQV
jgi:hypothetical protein